MADSPSTQTKDDKTPAPEVLKPQAEAVAQNAEKAPGAAAPKAPLRPRHVTYRPSHKATFIGLAVVIAILAINAGVIAYLMRGQAPGGGLGSNSEVTLSTGALDQLGVSRNNIGDLGTELVVGPNSRFNGKVVIGNDVNITGQLRLNSTFTAPAANFAKLEAGDVAVSQLNVNGDATATTLNLRRDLNVAGATRLQGPVTATQLFTVNNNLNVAGNVSVGGTLSARSFQASSLVSDSTLTIGGHIITRGAGISVGRGAGLGGVDSVSASGNDTTGTVAVNLSANATRSGILAHVAFRQDFGSTPRVVVTPVGPGASNVYVNRSASGFSIGVESISAGLSGRTVLFDYIVMQ